MNWCAVASATRESGCTCIAVCARWPRWTCLPGRNVGSWNYGGMNAMASVTSDPRPARGTAAWLQSLAVRVEAIRIDMAWMHPVEGNLTEGEMRNARRLGAELAGIAKEMEG